LAIRKLGIAASILCANCVPDFHGQADSKSANPTYGRPALYSSINS
jgi:hypothetical protein